MPSSSARLSFFTPFEKNGFVERRGGDEASEHYMEDASVVLASIGLTVSDAFRLMMVRIAAEKRLPFEPLIPNAETIEAMQAARRGDVVDVGGPEDLLADLNADD